MIRVLRVEALALGSNFLHSFQNPQYFGGGGTGLCVSLGRRALTEPRHIPKGGLGAVLEPSPFCLRGDLSASWQACAMSPVMRLVAYLSLSKTWPVKRRLSHVVLSSQLQPHSLLPVSEAAVAVGPLFDLWLSGQSLDFSWGHTWR